jgi:hypothetical protein
VGSNRVSYFDSKYPALPYHFYIFIGRVMTQVFSCRPVTVKAWLSTQATQSAIFGVHSGTGTDYFGLPCQNLSTKAPVMHK